MELRHATQHLSSLYPACCWILALAKDVGEYDYAVQFCRISTLTSSQSRARLWCTPAEQQGGRKVCPPLHSFPSIPANLHVQLLFQGQSATA